MYRRVAPREVWDAKTTENLHSFHPALSIGSHTEASVHTVYPLPGSTEQVLVSNRTSTAFLCTLQGQVVRSFTSPKVRGGGSEETQEWTGEGRFTIGPLVFLPVAGCNIQ